MGLIKKNTDYAIRALCYMAERDMGVVSAAALAEELGISWSLTRRILQELTRGGYIRSYRGKRGGFTLEIPARDIQVFDLVNRFQGALRFNNCVTGGRPCSNKRTCALRRRVAHLEKQVVSELKSLTIESLLHGDAPSYVS
jgi:Rrf2 family protein